MRQTTRITPWLQWLTMIAASAISIIAHAAVPQLPHGTSLPHQTSSPPSRHLIRRLPPTTDPLPAAFSIQDVANFDRRTMFDDALGDSFAAVFDIPAAAPGKPRVGGWIEVGYGAGWTIE